MQQITVHAHISAKTQTPAKSDYRSPDNQCPYNHSPQNRNTRQGLTHRSRTIHTALAGTPEDVLPMTATVGRSQHFTVNSRCINRLRECRCRERRGTPSASRLGKRIVRQENKGKSGRGNFDSTSVGTGVAVDGLNVFVALKTAVRFEMTSKRLPKRSKRA